MSKVLENSVDVKKNQNRFKIIILSVVGIIVVLGSVFGYFKYQQTQEAKQKEKYAKLLAETSVDMYFEFLLSSVIVSTYSDVWDNAIDNRKDFNIELSKFKDGISEKGLLKDREKGRDNIRDNMKLLQDPPKEFKESYVILKQMYGTYTKMVEQALSPTGSLIEFNRKTNDLASQFEQQKEELTITLPADVKKIKEKLEEEKNKKNKAKQI
ncbi:hypothetical protein [Neobacillus dielmonensis]|uniref:hypothetical protein n=1 Tax=Neobacillus dielmonensis TaxID=1347369 RepID=UPI0005A96C19|nr:hypothetical protein [Neobacillus dielmonensis]